MINSGLIYENMEGIYNIGLVETVKPFQNDFKVGLRRVNGNHPRK